MRRPDPQDGVPVELVELDEEDGTAGPDGPLRHEDAAPAHRRLLWWTGAAVLALVVVAVVAVNVLAARDAAARRAALADLPWVLPALDGTMEELWRADAGGWVVGETSAAVLVMDPNGLGGGLRAVDPLTGEVLWEIPTENGYCWPLQDFASGVDPLSSLPPEDSIVVCETMNGPDAEGNTTSEIASHSGLDGHRLATITLEGSVTATSVVGESYLVATTLDDGSVVVNLTDLRTGEASWTFRSEPERARRVFTDFWNVTHDDEVIFFDGPEDLALSRSTGAEVPAEEPPPSEGWALPDGGRVDLDGATAFNETGGRVVNEDGTVRFEFDGWPWSPFGFQDASGPEGGVFMVQQLDVENLTPSSSADLVGLDLATGAELWRRTDDQSSSPFLAIDGVAVLLAPSAATAIDLRTGEELWTHPADSVVYFSMPVTDGDVVVLADRSAGRLELVAVDLRNGEDRWRMAAPTGLSSVGLTSRKAILMITTEQLIAYRP